MVTVGETAGSAAIAGTSGGTPVGSGCDELTGTLADADVSADDLPDASLPDVAACRGRGPRACRSLRADRGLRALLIGGGGDDALRVPRSIAIDPLGHSHVADEVGGALHVFDKDGNRLQRLADLTLRGIGIVPLDLSFSGSGLLYVRAVPKSQLT